MEKKLIKASDISEVTDPVKCGPSPEKHFRWTIIGINGPWFIIESGIKTKDTFRANQVYVNLKDIL